MDEGTMREQHDETELIFLPPTSGMGDDGVYSVHGRVVLVWADTDLELVVPNGEVSREATKWLATDTPDAKESDLAPRAENGAFIVPWIRASSVGASSQTLQQKMIMVTEGGASGLIIGQRGIDRLHCSQFGNGPVVPDQAKLWKGSYRVNGGGQKNDGDFFLDYTDGINSDRVPAGCAVNTVIINSLDMQELSWALNERNPSSEEVDAADSAAIGPATPIKVDACTRKPALTASLSDGGGSSQVSKFSLQHDRIHLNFRHVFEHQRPILANTSPKASGQLDFLVHVRSYITSLTIVNWRIYPSMHLSLTFGALQVVLEMALVMYRALNVNHMGKMGALVLFITIMCGFNTSYPLAWWPARFTRARPAAKTGPSGGDYVGGLFTLLVILQFFGGAVGMFVYHGIVKELPGR
jgi:hypothetical protein